MAVFKTRQATFKTSEREMTEKKAVIITAIPCEYAAVILDRLNALIMDQLTAVAAWAFQVGQNIRRATSSCDEALYDSQCTADPEN